MLRARPSLSALLLALPIGAACGDASSDPRPSPDASLPADAAPVAHDAHDAHEDAGTGDRDADDDDAALPDAGPELPPQREIAQGLDVPTDQGPVHGKIVGATRAFLGIPYAKPPVGALRFAPPAAPEAFSGTFDATEYGPVCPQTIPVLGLASNSQEDCLTLNVWTPEPAPSERLPVLVWVHGGAFQLGDGGGFYDGAKLAAKAGAVVVTLNYRLGALGFLAHAGFAEDGGGPSGNWGILDQQAALAWVRANVSAFGGDARNVTLLGESAGGHSVCVHLGSPSSHGLFDKAIVQSGLCMRVADTRAEAHATGERFAAKLGCTGTPREQASCLRKADLAQIARESSVMDKSTLGGLPFVDPTKLFFFQPTLDGDVLPEQLEAAFARGAVPHLPILHGANVDEGVLFQTGLTGGARIGSKEQFESLVGMHYGGRLSEIEALYAPPATRDWSEALSQVTGDSLFYCPARRMAVYLAEAGIPNYLYRFAAPLDSLLTPEVSGRAFHSADIPYLFGNDYPLGAIPANKVALSDTLIGYWSRFARTGDPNGDGTEGPRFRPYDASAAEEFTFDVPVSVQALTKRQECALWQSIATRP